MELRRQALNKFQLKRRIVQLVKIWVFQKIEYFSRSLMEIDMWLVTRTANIIRYQSSMPMIPRRTCFRYSFTTIINLKNFIICRKYKFCGHVQKVSEKIIKFLNLRINLYVSTDAKGNFIEISKLADRSKFGRPNRLYDRGHLVGLCLGRQQLPASIGFELCQK